MRVAGHVGQQGLAQQPDGNKRAEGRGPRGARLGPWPLALGSPAPTTGLRSTALRGLFGLRLRLTGRCISIWYRQPAASRALTSTMLSLSSRGLFRWWALVVRIEDDHVHNRRRQLAAEHGVQEVHEQVSIGLRAEQGLEDAVDLGVDGVAHVQSIACCGRRRESLGAAFPSLHGRFAWCRGSASAPNPAALPPVHSARRRSREEACRGRASAREKDISRKGAKAQRRREE
jgi:hypothetical protein